MKRERLIQKPAATDSEDEEANKEQAARNAEAEAQADRLSSGGGRTASMFSSIAKNGIKSIGKGLLITGAADTACTVKNTARGVEALAKIQREQQLARYAMIYFNYADQQIAGEADGGSQAEYVGKKLMAIDTAKTIVNETSILGAGGKPKEVPNPYYGMNALDAPGYKAAAYNEAPKLTARDMEMTIGGTGMMGTLSSVNGFIDKELKGDSCEFIQNNAVRLGSLIVGIGAGIISLGTTFYVQAGLSIAIGMALPILENYLATMLAGKVVDSNTSGVDAGNAIFGGAGALFGGMARSRGMKPATKSDLRSYLKVSQNVKAEYVAMETEDAQKTPFDVYNQYSFLGSFVRKLMPVANKSSLSIGGSITKVSSLLSVASSSLSSNVSAANEFNEDRFSQCKDYGYEEIGIDADVFCNVRYAMSPYELGLDTDEVRGWMYTKGFVTDDGAPAGDYSDWLEECTNRQAGWGEVPQGEESDDLNGSRCMKTDKQSSYFRVYTMDDSIIEAMDYEPPTSSAGLSGGSEFRIASFNVLGAHHTDGPTADKPASWPSWSVRIQKSLAVIESNNFDVIAFQEFEPEQRKYLKENLTNYDITTHGKESDSIMWNTDRFTKVDTGTWRTVYFGGPIEEPWIKLRDRTTQQEFFVLSVHDPINNGQGNAQTRYENALAHKALIEKLQSQAPVLLVGDFNSGYNKSSGSGAASDDKLAYCVLAVNGPMNDAYDMSVPRTEKCPNKNKKGTQIDHIYLTPQIQVNSSKTDFGEIKSGASSNGSDHPTIFSDVIIPGAPTGAGTSFVIGTYNQKRSLSAADHEAAAKNIVDKGMDVVGTQESINPKFDRYKKYLTSNNYGLYPESLINSKAYLRTCAANQVIFYNKAKFKLIRSTYFEIPRYPDPAVDCGNGEKTTSSHNEAGLPKVWTHIPIVWLQDVETGQTVIVINTHNVANVSGAAGTQPAKSRWRAAQIYIDQIQKLKADNAGIPIFMTGDFNEGTNVRSQPGTNLTYQGKQENLLFCMFAQNNLMRSVIGPEMKCDPKYSIGGVDYIYASPNVETEWKKELSRAEAHSDHSVPYAKVTVPGSKSGSQLAGDLAWPVDKKWWNKYRYDFVDAHSADSGTWTSGVDSLAVDISSVGSGTPVYAMLGGRVTAASLGGHGLMISSPIQGGVLEIAYAHGPRWDKKSTYQTGDRIMTTGCLGKCYGPHLHIDMAFNGKGVCPQDVFIAMSKNEVPNFKELVKKGKAPCGRS